jgi:hypothetical protein
MLWDIFMGMYKSSQCVDIRNKKRDGFIYVGRNNDGTGSLIRYKKKKSFNWYKSVIKSNGSILVKKLSMKLVLAVWGKLGVAPLPLMCPLWRQR